MSPMSVPGWNLISVVHYLADRRRRVRGYLDKVEPAVVGHPLRIARRHDAEHLSVWVKNANLRNAYLVVYTSELCDNSPHLFCCWCGNFTISAAFMASVCVEKTRQRP